jgi:uncharacterized membrane protein
MKKFIKMVLIIAGSNLLLVWITGGLFVAMLPKESLWQFLGLVPSPPPSHWQNSVGLLLGVLSSPLSWLLTGMTSTFVLVVLSILNSFIWGVCIGFPLYVLKERLLAPTNPASSGRRKPRSQLPAQ